MATEHDPQSSQADYAAFEGTRAVGDALHDALQDRGDPEHVVREIEVPVLRHREARSFAVARDVLRFVGNPERAQVEPRNAAKALGRDVPSHAVIREIRERIAERRQFPVEHREHARRVRVEDQVVEPIVAVHDRHARVAPGFGAQMLRQPIDQPAHRIDRLGFRREILLAPARDLAREIVARLAVIGEPDRLRIDRMQRGDHAVHFVVVAAALGGRHAGQRRIPQHAAVDERHHVEEMLRAAGQPAAADAVAGR